MTKEMAEEITKLRLKGLGYKSIAIVVGTSRENVRYYCKTHDLAGDAELLKQKYLKENNNTPEKCKYCGRRIPRNSHSGKKLYCSDACRRAWWKAHPGDMQRSAEHTYLFECAYCGVPFTAYGNKNRKYCSHNCFVLDRFWKDPKVSVKKFSPQRQAIKFDWEDKIKRIK